MKKLILPILFVFFVSSQTFSQDVNGMETYPAKEGHLYQEFDSYQLDETLPDKVSLTELRVDNVERMPIAVPPLGNYVNFQLKKLRVPSNASLPALERKGKLSDTEELLYPERVFYVIFPEKRTDD